MKSPPSPSRETPPHRFHLALRWSVVFAVPAALAVLFVWCAGWFSSRLDASRIVDAFEATSSPHAGFRRNHAKGVCITGHFESSGAAASLSRASVFARGDYPVVGRFSLPGTNPTAEDGSIAVRSLALRIALPQGEQWRLAMNSTPIFAVRTPQELIEQLKAQKQDPNTGQMDMGKMRMFLDHHPEARAFRTWMKSHPPSSRYDNASYYGISSFKVTDAQGVSHYVRWKVVPESPYREMDESEGSDPDFLSRKLQTQIARGPLRWHLVLDVALPGDPLDDSTRQWADLPQRQHIEAGTFVFDHAQSQIDGPCRDITFDPTILPQGIAPSNDPLLAARSASYQISFDRRVREQVENKTALP